MEELEVIEKVEEPTDWVNSTVTIVKSNGKLRICIDPCDLNKAVKRDYYPMSTIDEIVTRMPNAKVFTVLDASLGFLQIKLDMPAPNSILLTLYLADICSNASHLDSHHHRTLFRKLCQRCFRI